MLVELPGVRAKAVPPTEGDAAQAPGSKSEREQHEDHDILCAACGAKVTRRQHAIAMQGEHTHVFVNPSGIPFDIACYREADGCVVDGKPETFYSWFAGFAWQFASCAACGVHLGWRFVGEAVHFFGLIRARLRDAE